MPGWTLQDIPDLSGRTAIVTGGNVGLGFKSVLELARKGARVFIACHSIDRGDAAAAHIQADVGVAQLDVLELDLTDPASIERFAGEVSSRTDRLDILLNNAGVVSLASLQRTPAGHEMHMATNHYGHFAVTGHLFPLLIATPDARVVSITSGVYRRGTIDFDDLDWRKRPYNRTRSGGREVRLLWTAFHHLGACLPNLHRREGPQMMSWQKSSGASRKK